MTTKMPHSPYTTLGIAASNSMRFFSRPSNFSGSPPQKEWNWTPNNLRIENTSDDKNRSLRKTATARPKMVPIIRAKTELYNVPQICGSIPYAS